MDSDPQRPALDRSPLRDGLVGPGLPWRQLEVVDETGSTNADLLARAAAGVDIDGVALVAEYQTAGRGRHGRHWSAPPRSQIALSVGVGAGDVPADAWGWLPLATGVAVVDALSEVTGIVAGLKWPNDVLVGSGKLAGILAEVAAPEPVIVVGLGLNVTLTADEAPDPAATSLLDARLAGDRSKCVAARGASPFGGSHRRLARRGRRRCHARRGLPEAQPDDRYPRAGQPARRPRRRRDRRRRRPSWAGFASTPANRWSPCRPAISRICGPWATAALGRVPAWATRRTCWPTTSRWCCTGTRTGSG